MSAVLEFSTAFGGRRQRSTICPPTATPETPKPLDPFLGTVISGFTIPPFSLPGVLRHP